MVYEQRFGSSNSCLDCGVTFLSASDARAHRTAAHPVAPIAKPAKQPKRRRAGVSPETRLSVIGRDMRCMADGLHHHECPADWMKAPTAQFVAHHVIPRRNNGPDVESNLMLSVCCPNLQLATLATTRGTGTASQKQ